VKTVRNAIYAVLLIAFAVGEARADALGKFGDCSERSVDPDPLTFSQCGDEQSVSCFFDHALAASRGVRRCRQQTLVGADLAGLAWLLGNKGKAKRLADHVVNKVYSISNKQTRIGAMRDIASRFGFYGMETYVRDITLHLPALVEAYVLAILARRQAYLCDWQKAENLLNHVERILAENNVTDAKRLWPHFDLTITYHFMDRSNDAVRHARAVEQLLQRLAPIFHESSLWVLPGALAGAGRVSEAERAADRIDEPSQRAFALAVIAEIFAFHNEGDAADRAVASAERLLARTDEQDPGTLRFLELNVARLRLGQPLSLGTITDPYNRATTYARLGRVLSDMQNGIGPGRCR